MFEAAADGEARRSRLQAAFVANIINLAGRPLKRAVTVDGLLGIEAPRKRYKWRKAADVIREDQERAARQGATS